MQEIKLLTYTWPKLDVVHGDSVERLVIEELEQIEVKDLKNLKHLYTGDSSRIDSTLLFDLEQVQEIHLDHQSSVSQLFDQKERYGRDDLKIYLRGLLLNGPDDLAIDSLQQKSLRLTKNSTRLADKIPFYFEPLYKVIERVTPALAINLLNRFTDLKSIWVVRSGHRTLSGPSEELWQHRSVRVYV